MATAQEIMKGRKKEELAEEIVRLRADLERAQYNALKMENSKDQIISDLMVQIKSKEDEYKRWKEYHGEFVRRIIGEYMADYKDDITSEVGEKIVHQFSIETHPTADYYSHGTDIRLLYGGEVISSDYISQ